MSSRGRTNNITDKKQGLSHFAQLITQSSTSFDSNKQVNTHQVITPSINCTALVHTKFIHKLLYL